MKLALLGEVCDLIRGVTFDASSTRSSSSPGYMPILRAGNIQEALETDRDLVWVPGRFVCEEQLLRSGDIAICLSSGSPKLVGKTALLRQSWRGAVGAFCGILRARAEIKPEYLALWLRSEGFDHWLESQVRGANIQNLRFSELAKLQCPMPPRDVQERIALRVESQLREAARARAAAEARLEAASALLSSLLAEYFAEAASKGSARRRLGGILDLRKDVVHPRDRPSGPATFVGLEHIESGSGLRVGCVEVDKAELTGRKPSFRTGDIVYGYLRPYLNKVWVAEFDGLCSVDQYVYAVNPAVAFNRYVAWFIRSPLFLARAPISTAPGQLPRIRTDEVAEVEIELPSLREQEESVANLEATLEQVRRAREAARSEVGLTAALPAALLRRAFGGEL